MSLCLHAETNNDTLIASALCGQDSSCAKMEKRNTFKQSLFLLLPNITLKSVVNHSRVHSSRTPLSSPTKTKNKMKIELLVLPVTLVQPT